MNYNTVEKLRQSIKVEQVFREVFGQDTPITRKIKLEDKCYDNKFTGKSFRYEIEITYPYSDLDDSPRRIRLFFEIFQSDNELRVYFIPDGKIELQNTSGPIKGLYLLLCVKEDAGSLIYDNDFIDQNNSWSNITFPKYTGSGYINRWLADTIYSFQFKTSSGDYGYYENFEDIEDDLDVKFCLKRAFHIRPVESMVKYNGREMHKFSVRTKNTAGYAKDSLKKVKSFNDFENPLCINFYLIYHDECGGYYELTNDWFRVFKICDEHLSRKPLSIPQDAEMEWLKESFEFYITSSPYKMSIEDAIIEAMKKWIAEHKIFKEVKF